MNFKNYLVVLVSLFTIVGSIVGATAYLNKSIHSLDSKIFVLENKMVSAFAITDKEMASGFAKADKEIGIIKTVLLMKGLIPPELVATKNTEENKNG